MTTTTDNANQTTNMMTDNRLIGLRIKFAREFNCMTQQRLADNLFVSQQAVSQWESGKTYVDGAELMMTTSSARPTSRRSVSTIGRRQSP